MNEFPSSPIPASVPKNLRPRIWFWDDERSEGNSIIVTLRHGWCFTDDGQGCHVRGADTVRDAVSNLRYSGPCHCEQCIEATA